MRIIEIIPQLSSGGAERFTVDLCNELSKQHEIVLIVLHKLGKNDFFLKELDTSIKVISMNKRRGLDFILFFKIKQLIKKINPDVVHTHLSGILYTALAYIKFTKIIFIHTIHNDAYVEAGQNIKKWIRQYAFKNHKVYPITISEESQQSFHNCYHSSSTLIYNGSTPYYIKPTHNIAVELNSLKTNRNSINLLNVARLQPEKNQLTLVKAVIHLNKIGYPIDLFLIGRKTPNITFAIQALNSPYIHILGERDNPRDYMKEVDAFCLPSIYEGMPITLIECFSVGTIPICTPVGGIVNMIKDTENGFLTKGINQTELEQTIIRFMKTNAEEKKHISAHCLETFQKYHIQTCAEKYIQLMILLSSSTKHQHNQTYL